jgi:quinohemoprotein amine dehydrogenase
MLKTSSLIISAMLVAGAAHAQTPAAAPSAPGTTATKDEGFPIDNELVRSKCGGCHRSDDKKRMSRISYRRATPENWEKTIRRMVSLNHATLDPADARAILKYLSDHLGLAPEELRPIAFEPEHRMVEYTYTADKDTADTCGSCHSMSRVASERRTKEEWSLLVAMHRGYYPLVDNQPMNNGMGFRRTRPRETEPGADGRPPDNRHPMDKAIEHLEKAFPLSTSDWSAWSAAVQPPRLAGRWAIVGTTAGKGMVYGQVTITADSSAPDSFNTDVKYTVARTGESVARTGKAVVYTGYQWRGRGAVGTDSPWREVMFIERGWNEMWGRWYTGAYDETGVDVKLVRLTGAPVVFGTSVSALRTGGGNQPVKIFGANFPASPKPEDIALGQGVKIARVVNATADEVSVEVEVAANAPIGVRDLSIGGAAKPSALVVYDKIDAIKVQPQAGMARVGGAVFPKQLQQFEAVGVNYGPDGKPDTPDDLVLGLVDVIWSLEEYTATFTDDDLQFVGGINDRGLFTPALDGPNPKRSGNRNNVGDVWVVAELNSPDARDTSKRLRARAHLLVTVPLYMNWLMEEPTK